MKETFPVSATGSSGGQAPGSLPGPTAAIEIGSTGIRLLVASIDGTGSMKVLERAGKASRIGRDVFTQGSIGREAMRECIAVLASFKELLAGYGIAPEEAKAIGTSAIREATNRDTFLDRVSLQTGFRVRVVEDIEENHLMYLAVQHALQDERKTLSKTNAMILEVGGGTTEIMLLRRGKMVSSHSLHFGTLRLDEQMKEAGTSKEYLEEYLASNIRTACDLMTKDLPLESVKSFIVVGSDARFAAYCVSGKNYPGYSVLERESFLAFAQSISRMSVEECIAAYHLPWSEADGLASGLAIESLFLARTGAEEVVVPNVSIREGLLLAEVRGIDPGVAEELERQVIASAMAVGKRYRYDENHARFVRAASLGIFDALKAEHGLGRRERLLLEASAVLHDIGTYIRASGHHRHGEYIVANSEFFGLNRSDISIVSNVVRYHRKAPPSPAHLNYISLPREDRIIVMKLSAILRVADALDRNHAGRLMGAGFEKTKDRFLIRSDKNLDFSLERLSLADKGDLFEDVFGLAPTIL
ncbi:MAG TPA: HD domain-containing protein [Rectinemataceae bacterium]